MVGGLFWGEPRDGRKDAEGVAGQENDVLRVTALGVVGAVVDEFDRVGATGVLRFARVSKVGHAALIEDDVFQHRAEATGGAEDGRLVFFGEIDELGVAPSFEVEDAVGAPTVLVVTDEGALGICGKRGLSGAGEPEENGRVLAVGVGRTVHGEDALLRQDEVHHREDRLLDFTSVSASANDHFFGGVIDDDKDVGIHAINLWDGLKVRCVKHGELRRMIGQFILVWADKHVPGKGAVPSVVGHHADGEGFA